MQELEGSLVRIDGVADVFVKFGRDIGATELVSDELNHAGGPGYTMVTDMIRSGDRRANKEGNGTVSADSRVAEAGY